METLTDRTQYREVLASLVQKTQARFPDLNGRLTKATKLALLQDVELHDDGTATVHSASDPTRHYRIVEGTCTCRDWEQAPEHLCQHRLAAGLVRKATEVLALASPVAPICDPAPPVCDTVAQTPPLPEAPVSITLKATLHGHEVLVTLRGVDFASVKAHVEEASQWLQAQSGQTADDTPQCPTHGAMKRSTKSKGWYCPHKRADGSWCKGTLCRESGK